MRFFDHSALAGRHSFLSASKYHWVNYDEDKLYETFLTAMDAAMGTRLHSLAAELILLKQKLADTTQTLNSYVNDAIAFRMQPEVMFVVSENCFGTADAVSFYNNTLRIHDLKNGVTPAKMTQLVIYACMFMIEYKFKPNEIDIVLRIYQNDEIVEYIPSLDELTHVIDKILTFDEKITEWKTKGRS